MISSFHNLATTVATEIAHGSNIVILYYLVHKPLDKIIILDPTNSLKQLIYYHNYIWEKHYCNCTVISPLSIYLSIENHKENSKHFIEFEGRVLCGRQVHCSPHSHQIAHPTCFSPSGCLCKLVNLLYNLVLLSW